MRPVRSRSRAVSTIGVTVIAVAIGTFIVMFAGWHGHTSAVPATGIVVIRGVPVTSAEAVPLTPSTPALISPTALPIEAAVADIRQTYPLLSDVKMDCQAGQCVLTATIQPLISQRDLDLRQEMLLGGLAAALAEDGYRMAVPFDMDEVADNTFHIRAHATADGHP